MRHEFFMQPRRLLYLTTDRMNAFHWRSGVLSHEASFPSTNAGRAEFSAYLAENSKSVFSLLVDVPEEGFHTDNIPALKGADRQALVMRKLAQLFFSAPLTSAQSLGFYKAQRKEERIAFFALTDGDFLKPWINLFHSTRTALSGIYSPLLLATPLIKASGIETECCLLLMVQAGALRQFYFEKGELRFSRVTAILGENAVKVAQAIVAEAAKAWQYLEKRQRQGQIIDAYIFTRRMYSDVFNTFCVDTPAIRFHLFDRGDICSQRLGIKQLPPGMFCESMFLGLMIQSPPDAQFANDDLLRVYHLGFVRTVFHSIGLATLLICLVFSAFCLYESEALLRKTAALEAESGAIRSNYDNIVKSFPSASSSQLVLRDVVQRYAEIERGGLSPKSLYIEISRALADAPTVAIDAIDWKNAGASCEGAAGSAAVVCDAESAIVRGTVQADGTVGPREIVEIFERFVQALTLNPTLRVTAQKRPFDIEPEKTLKSDDLANADTPRSFVLRLRRQRQ